MVDLFVAFLLQYYKGPFHTHDNNNNKHRTQGKIPK